METAADERAIQVIRNAVRLIDNPARWIRGTGAMDDQGRACGPDDIDAHRFRLYEALLHVSGHTGSEDERCRTPGLRDVHEAIRRRLQAEGLSMTCDWDNPNPGALVVAWNDDGQVDHKDVLAVLADAEAAIRIRGRSLDWNEEPEAELRTTGHPDLDRAMWEVVRTLSDETEGNSDLIDAGEDLVRAWHAWQRDFR